MSLDLKGANETQFKGVIKGVEAMSRAESLGDRAKKFIEAMDEKYYPDGLKKYIKANPDDAEDKIEEYKQSVLDNVGLVFTVEVDGVTFPEWINLPGRRGYNKSHLKTIVDKNSLPLVRLPEEAVSWCGLELWCELDGNYYRISK